MKKPILIICLLTYCISFSQSKTKPDTTLPLFLEFITPNKILHYESTALTSLSQLQYSIDQLETIRQGHFVISPKNFKPNFASIDPVPSLNIELNKIMYTGNNFNPLFTRFNFKKQ